MMNKQLSDREIKVLREVIRWYESEVEREKRDFELEEELAKIEIEG